MHLLVMSTLKVSNFWGAYHKEGAFLCKGDVIVDKRRACHRVPVDIDVVYKYVKVFRYFCYSLFWID